MKQMHKSYLPIVILVVAFVTMFASSPAIDAKPRVQNFTVKITERGFEPVTLRLRRGAPARITFLRTTNNTCATEIVLRDFGIRKALPLNQPVVITVTPNRKGDFEFTCGMNMMRGKLIVQ